MPITKTDAATTSSAPTTSRQRHQQPGREYPDRPPEHHVGPRSAVPQRLRGARDEEEADACADAHRSPGRQVVSRIGDRGAEARREQRDPGDEHERQVHHGVAQTAHAAAQLKPSKAPLDRRGGVAEEDPREHRDGGEAQHGGDPRRAVQCASSSAMIAGSIRRRRSRRAGPRARRGDRRRAPRAATSLPAEEAQQETSMATATPRARTATAADHDRHDPERAGAGVEPGRHQGRRSRGAS